ncbi:hypothetical protein [Portibacter lacus]|uniref:Uncharacterized protein n=1 Tax=Portibacter lacus TaxID=1099794 RepID=A0AA37SJ38_9BACT|nr:hypothetical protein [Portibacter lacus]GLR15758.1 hypothetical protein GCM10007940_03730 [Portibacter lacus]
MNNYIRLYTTIFIWAFIIANGKAQVSAQKFTYKNYENEILAYQPLQSNVSDKDYNHAMMILSETKAAVENNPSNFNRADYYNVLSVFLSMQESEEHIRLAYAKFKEAEGSCEYFLAAGLFDSKSYDLLREDINKQVKTCKNSGDNEVPLDLKAYAKENNLDFNTLLTMERINSADAKYRKGDKTDWTKQNLLDRQNQKSIDSMFQIYNAYVGRSLVGEEYESVMWSVVQHSSLETMEKYLLVVHQAVKANELGKTPFKMLIDRYYGLKFGYQIFGSQSGFGFQMADEKTRKEIIALYGIE